MGKKKQKFSGTNLRILSIAYANKRIDRTTYLKLRTQQLGAIEFNKPIPELPANLMEIVVPSIKVDAPSGGVSTSGGNFVWRYVAIAALLIAASVTGLWFADVIPGSKSEKPVQIRQLEPVDYAERLLRNPDWNERDINAFLRTWGTRTEVAKTAARNSQWYLALENEIIKRINKTRLQLERNPDLQAEQRELARLNRFYGQLTSN